MLLMMLLFLLLLPLLSYPLHGNPLPCHFD
jgi:hypothetical protein